MLDKLSATYNEAGLCLRCAVYCSQENSGCKTSQVLILVKTALMVWNLILFQNKINNKQRHKNKGNANKASCTLRVFLFLTVPFFFFLLHCCQTVDVSSCALLLIQLFKREPISARPVVIICAGRQEEAGWHRTWWMAGGGRGVRRTDVMCGKKDGAPGKGEAQVDGKNNGRRRSQRRAAARGTNRTREAERWI